MVAVMGNWFGKKNRGLLLGVWNAHTSVGNILGTAVPAIWAVRGQAWYVNLISRLNIFDVACEKNPPIFNMQQLGDEASVMKSV